MGIVILHWCTDSLLVRVVALKAVIIVVTIVDGRGIVDAADMRQVIVWRCAEQLLVQVQIEYLEASIHRLDEHIDELGTINHIPYLEADGRGMIDTCMMGRIDYA